MCHDELLDGNFIDDTSHTKHAGLLVDSCMPQLLTARSSLTICRVENLLHRLELRFYETEDLKVRYVFCLKNGKCLSVVLLQDPEIARINKRLH